MGFFNSFPYTNFHEMNLDWIIKKINGLLADMDTNNKNVSELTEYVRDYFKNLDVSKEVDNKLDEMANSGELAEIIADYLYFKSVLIFKTVQDMIDSTVIKDGSCAYCEGFYNVGDGGGSFYSISNSGVADGISVIACKNGLLASNTNISNNILCYGAKSDGSNDCGEIINKTLEIHNSAQIPRGRFKIETPVVVINQTIQGTGFDCVLYGSGNLPCIVKAGRSAVLNNIAFAGENLSENCSAILCFYEYPLQRTRISNIRIEGVPYGVKDNGTDPVFSVHFDSMEFSGCKKAAISLTANYMTANTFSNIYISGINDEDIMEYGILISGKSTSMVINEMNVEHGIYTASPADFRNCNSLLIESLHFERCTITAAYNGFINISKTNLNIGNLSVAMCHSEAAGMCIMKMAESGGWEEGLANSENNNNNIKIDSLVIWGLNTDKGGITISTDYYTFERPNAYQGARYNIYVDNYVWFSYTDDGEFLRNIKFLNYDNINVVKLPDSNIVVSTYPTENLYVGKLCYINNTLQMWNGYIWLNINKLAD